jgi:hypothetical protein
MRPKATKHHVHHEREHFYLSALKLILAPPLGLRNYIGIVILPVVARSENTTSTLVLQLDVDTISQVNILPMVCLRGRTRISPNVHGDKSSIYRRYLFSLLFGYLNTYFTPNYS